MSVTKLPSDKCTATKAKGGWCVRDRHRDGRTVHRHFARKDEAENFVIRIRAERIGGATVERRTRMTFEAYAETWRQAQTWKDTDGAYYSLRRAYAIIGGRQLDTVDGLALQVLQRKLFQHPYARATVEQTMHFVKAALRQAHADRLISTDPTARVRLPRRDSLDRNGRVTAQDVPTRDEALAIIVGSPAHYRAANALGLGCGLRIGEVLGLTPSRIDLAAGTITIDRQHVRGGLDSPKTWRGVRTIEPPDLVMTELHRAVRAAGAPEMPMFTGARGGGLRRDGFYAAAWRPALRAAGIDERRYKFHAARHFAVSNMLGRGVSVVEVAAYVGDSAETIMGTYAHFLRESESQAKRALDLAFSSPVDNPARETVSGAAGKSPRDRTVTGHPSERT